MVVDAGTLSQEDNDPKAGYAIYWTGVSYSRKREQAFRCDSRDFAEASKTMCNTELHYLTFEVQPA